MAAEFEERLVGRALPAVRLPSTEGGEVDLGALKGSWHGGHARRHDPRRFHLPFPLLSDADLRLARALDLPTVVVAGETLLRGRTLIADPQGVTRKVYDEIPDPGGHALEVARCLKGVRNSGGGA